MKKIILLLFAPLLFACKTGQSSASKTLTGRLVIKENCNHYVVSLESGQLDTSRIAATWKDEKRNTSFTNVFTVASSCSFGQAGLNEGDLFSFEVSDGPPEACAVCLMFYPTPDKKLAIKNIKKISP